MNHFFSSSLACLSFAMACGAQVTNWTEVNTNPTNPRPPVRQNHPMVYDSVRGVCVMFGGFTNTNLGGIKTGSFNDTWEWDGTNWKQINTPNSPPVNAAHALAYDSRRQVTVMTKGNNATTWEYNGTTWTQKTPVNHHPFGGHRPMTYDSARGVCVAFGTVSGVNQTWEWDGTNWTRIMTPTIPGISCSSCSLAFDTLRRVMVTVSNGQTWEYDGTDWTRVLTATTPPSRSCSYGLVYDDARQVVVMFGGCGSPVGDTWEYDGSDWRRYQTANAPVTERRYLAMAYDSKRRRTVLFGGRDHNRPWHLNDTWEYSRGDCFMMPNTATINITTGGSQRLAIDAGTSHSSNLYWIFGSMSGTTPGLSVFGPHIYLNPDLYTDFALAFTNTAVFFQFRGVLDTNGRATADFVVPPGVAPIATLHHAAFVYLSTITCSTNPVLVQLK